MGRTSKDLLHLERKNPSTSPLESTLLVCRKNSLPQTQKLLSDEKPITAPPPKTQVLGKIKDFLGVISEANERLQLGAKDNSENHDIEVLTGNESAVIEMNLMLGVADLHTSEAVAAAESAIAGFQPVIPLACSSSGTDSDDSSDNDSDDNGDEDGETCSPVKLKKSKPGQDNCSSGDDVIRSKKRPKIVVLP
ncbi:hypothetical protein I3843_05G162800 [Carya illinoinensis]|uniref:Uncharacterized protein n=1 Tax=Carya illinoinensis TaxID=32201 RepID=A0A922F119_CARIL|nr:hypothetical protein I3760_05G178400 [Carya illinoinensis]KAG6713938.1 hypothetical protein I3842_05G178000 [Carya illinoinensis]KAG7980076.1 hypothetical protein I3843_05G162800 [Carya illinoinensis]